MLPWTLRRLLGLPDPEPDTGVVAAPPVLSPANAAYNPELSAALVRNPEDASAFRAYAQWLSHNGDPRGALIGAQLDGEDDTELLEAHRDHFEGPLAWREAVTLSWRWGFWDSVEIASTWDGAEAAELCAALVQHPSALVLRALTVDAEDLAGAVDGLADGPVLPLRTLVLKTPGTLGTFASLWARVPKLRRLELSGLRPQLGDLALLELEELLLSGEIDDDAARSLERMNTPALRLLRLDVPETVELRAHLAALRDRDGLEVQVIGS